MPGFYWVLLPVSVWFIYLLDHIVDGMKVRDKFFNEKYNFYFLHKKPLIALLIIMMIFNSYLALQYISLQLLLFGIVLSLIVVLYFILHHFLQAFRFYFLQKEFLIGLVYTAGIFGGPVVLTGQVNKIQIIVMISYLLMVLANIFSYSYFEYELDLKIRAKSVAVVYGDSTARKLEMIVLIISCGLSLLLIFLYNLYIIGALHLFVTLLLLVIVILPDKFKENGLYGKLADGLFILPGLIAFF